MTTSSERPAEGTEVHYEGVVREELRESLFQYHRTMLNSDTQRAIEKVIVELVEERERAAVELAKDEWTRDNDYAVLTRVRNEYAR